MNVAHPFREGNGRALYMKGIDVSYYYEGYSEFKTEDL
jgi:cell filamentation protein